jgi:predicted site-specific integrase-resolvase
MPVLARRVPWGTIVVEVSVGEVSGRAVVYVRVCSDEQRRDLEAQAGCVMTGCARQVLRVDDVVTEVGSGVRRSKPARLCGRRGARDRAMRVVTATKRDSVDGDSVEELAV